MTSSEVPASIPVGDYASPLNDAWCHVGDVPYSARRRVDLGDADEWERQCWRASELLYRFTGQRWRGRGGQRTVVLDARPAEGLWDRSWAACDCWRYEAGTLPAGPLAMGQGRHGRPRSIGLPDPDASRVLEVRVAGQVVTNYRLTPAGRLERLGKVGWSVCGGETEVDYAFGWAPPQGAVQAAADLTVQYAKAVVGADTDLPDRLTSVTREAMSWTFADPSQSVDDLLTGVDRIDRWIRSVNPYGRSEEASVISPDLYTARPR